MKQSIAGRSFVERLVRLLALVGGSVVLGLGVVFLIGSSWGPASWDVLHLAIAERSGLSAGQVSIITSLCIITVTVLLRGGWTVRWGTLVNTFVVGIAIDIFMRMGVPNVSAAGARLLYVLLGTFFLALGSVVYTRAGYGAGARDGLILVLSQRLPFTFGRVRLGLEVLVSAAGWLLGGPIGPATAVITFGTGPTADLIFRVVGRGHLPDTVRIPERAA